MRNSTGGGYNQTALGWQIGVFDRETGRMFTKTNAVGSGMRPELSPDGKWLAYATRNNADESLMLRDLATGDERLLLPKIQRDDQESRPNRDLLPTYSFTPDSKSIIIGHHGHFWRANVADGPRDDDPVHRRRRHDDRRADERDVSAQRFSRSPCVRFATSRRRPTTSGWRSSRSIGCG